MSNDITQNRSGLKEFLASIATISGDLSNITAPPFVLADNSTVEIPQYWADHPYLWAAPATEENPEKRALLVLKNFLGSLRGQQYGGRREEDGVKKPLNAFLGELFLGSWDIHELGQTRLVSEQVSHHPPITACYLWNDRVGIRAEGFTEQEITFNGNVVINQMGYAIVHLDKYDEDYLLPLPNIKVKGLLTGTPHPELYGDYSLICSNGYVSHIHFEGKSLLGSGQKNGFHARFFHKDNPSDIIYTIEGAWNSTFVIKDARSDKEIETFDVRSITQKPITVPDLSEQDPWESRKAWQHVIAALRKGDMKAVVKAKSEVENGQRQMRKDEAANGTKFEPIFFKKLDKDPVFDKLVQFDPQGFTLDPKAGIWKVDRETADTKSRPFHPELTPANKPRRPTTGSQRYSDSSTNSTKTSNSSAAESTRDPLPPPQELQQQQHQSGAKVSTTAADNASAAARTAPDASAADVVVQNGTLEHAGRAATSVVDPGTTATAAGTKASSREEHEPSKEEVEEFLRRKTGNVH